MEPVLYLDVDGVLFADTDELHISPARRDVTVNAVTYTVRYDEETASKLGPLLGKVQLTWLTTWEQHAPTVVANLVQFGANAPFLTSHGRRKFGDHSTISWKQRALAAKWAEHPHRFIWIDDEAPIEHHWHEDKAEQGHAAARSLIWDAGLEDDEMYVPPFLIIRPESSRGIHQNDIDLAIAFTTGTIETPPDHTIMWAGGTVNAT